MTLRHLMTALGWCVTLTLVLAVTGCGSADADSPDNHAAQESCEDGACEHEHGAAEDHEGDDHEDGAPDHDHAAEASSAMSGGDSGGTIVEIPQAVRENLGITFSRVEWRAVRRTVRVPGEFELRPDARREHHATMPGRVSLSVREFDRVESGDLIARIDSPQWATLRHEAVEAEGEIRLAQAAINVAEAKITEARSRIAFSERRLEQLKAAGNRDVELESKVDELRNTLPRLEAELNARKVELEEAHEHFQSRLSVMASLTGLSRAALEAPIEAEGGAAPRWRTDQSIELRAERAGIVDQTPVTHGGWVEAGAMVVSIVDASAIRFHAHAPQTDITRFRDGQPGRVVPPAGGSLEGVEALAGAIHVGFRAHPEERTIPIYMEPQARPAWAKPGVSAFLEVVVDGDDAPVLAVPREAVVKDGLKMVLFKRKRGEADKAVRVEARLGASDGRWVEVRGNVAEGDQIVLIGAHALKLATSSRPAAPEGYHYHADGTLHKDH